MISACMIVKNEEWIIGKTLPSLVKCLDEVVVVDTGSTDRTPDLARELGAKVSNFKWIDDFAAARNESLKQATGDWILWIDADEYLKEEDLLKLKEYLSKAEADSYQLELRECKPGEFEFTNVYFRVKLFRNRKGFHFERPINEQVADGKGDFVGGKVIPEVAIYHWGSRVGAEKKQQKKQRNIDLLRKAAENNPGDPYYSYLLANNLKETGMNQEAVPAFLRTIELSPKGHLAAPSYAALAWCYYRLRKGLEAFQSAKKALELDQNLPDAYNLMGLILGGAGKYDEALSLLNTACSLEPAKGTSKNINMRQYRYTPNYYKGLVYEMAGDKDKAREAFIEASKFEMTDEVRGKLNGR